MVAETRAERVVKHKICAIICETPAFKQKTKYLDHILNRRIYLLNRWRILPNLRKYETEMRPNKSMNKVCMFRVGVMTGSSHVSVLQNMQANLYYTEVVFIRDIILVRILINLSLLPLTVTLFRKQN